MVALHKQRIAQMVMQAAMEEKAQLPYQAQSLLLPQEVMEVQVELTLAPQAEQYLITVTFKARSELLPQAQVLLE
jgi:hypothetical protein